MCLHPTKVEGMSIFQRQDAGKKITTCTQKNPLRAKRILTSNYGTRYKNHVSPANIYIQLYILTRNKMVRRSSYTPKFLYWKNVLQGLFSSSLAARWPGNDSSPSRSKSNAWERCLARQICPASNQTGRVVCVLQI